MISLKTKEEIKLMEEGGEKLKRREKHTIRPK